MLIRLCFSIIRMRSQTTYTGEKESESTPRSPDGSKEVIHCATSQVQTKQIIDSLCTTLENKNKSSVGILTSWLINQFCSLIAAIYSCDKQIFLATTYAPCYCSLRKAKHKNHSHPHSGDWQWTNETVAGCKQVCLAS